MLGWRFVRYEQVALAARASRESHLHSTRHFGCCVGREVAAG
jgi:hypothetical protein